MYHDTSFMIHVYITNLYRIAWALERNGFFFFFFFFFLQVISVSYWFSYIVWNDSSLRTRVANR